MEKGNQRMRGDKRMIAVTGQDREGQRCRCLWVLTAPMPIALALRETPKPTPRKETEAEKRLGEKRFAKKSLLIGLHYSCYRISLDCRGVRPARHAW